MDEMTRTDQTVPAETEEGRETTRGAQIYRPVTDILESKDGVILTLEMPGVAPDAVDIELEGGVLSVRGRAKMTNAGTYRLAYAEYGEGDYERTFTLSDDLDPSKIEAEMRNGLLTLTLPRTEAAKPQRIQVKAG